MNNEKNCIIIQKIIDRIERSINYCKDYSFDDFENNTMMQEACVFNILQIGELSKQNLCESFIKAHTEIPWKQIYGLRNRIVHGYEGVRLNIVWDTIVDDFPILLEQLKTILTNYIIK